jgi:hypothetical protein
VQQTDFTITNASATLLLGNLLDGLFTLIFLQLHMAEELNPLMRWAYAGSPLGFMLVKLLMVQTALVLLCLNRGMRAARLVENAGATLYGGLVLYHLACVAILPMS